MFDSYILRAGDQHHHHRSEVHEHRAPTDASVKLLREMEQAALDRVLGTIRLDSSSPVNGVVVHRRSLVGDHDEFLIRYEMNGKVHDVRHEFVRRYEEDGRAMVERAALELRDAMAKHIATVFLSRTFLAAAAELRLS